MAADIAVFLGLFLLLAMAVEGFVILDAIEESKNEILKRLAGDKPLATKEGQEYL